MGNMYYLSTYLYISEHNNPRVGWGSSLYLIYVCWEKGVVWERTGITLSLSLSLLSHVAVPKDSNMCYVGTNVCVCTLYRC